MIFAWHAYVTTNGRWNRAIGCNHARTRLIISNIGVRNVLVDVCDTSSVFYFIKPGTALRLDWKGAVFIKTETHGKNLLEIEEYE